MLKAMRRRFKVAKRKFKMIDQNPTDGIEPIDHETDGFKEWTTDQIKQFLDYHPIGSTAHLALTLYLATACRRSDVVKLGRGNVIGDYGEFWIEFTPTKGGRKNREKVAVPIDPYLAKVLSETDLGSETFLETDYGKPFSAKGFGNRMRKWIDQAGLPDDISSHGVRKTIGNILAEADCTPYQIMAVHGHSSPKASEIYTRKAQRKKLAQQGLARAEIGKTLGLKS